MDPFHKRLKRMQGELVAGDDCVFDEDQLEPGDFLFAPVSGRAVSKRWVAKNCLGMTDEDYDNAVLQANARYAPWKNNGYTRE